MSSGKKKPYRYFRASAFPTGAHPPPIPGAPRRDRIFYFPANRPGVRRRPRLEKAPIAISRLGGFPLGGQVTSEKSIIYHLHPNLLEIILARVLAGSGWELLPGRRRRIFFPFLKAFPGRQFELRAGEGNQKDLPCLIPDKGEEEKRKKEEKAGKK